MIEEDMNIIKEELEKLSKKFDEIIKIDGIKSEFINDLSVDNEMVLGKLDTGLLTIDTNISESFYNGSVAIGRAIKKPLTIINDLINSMNIETKKKFFNEIKPIIKKYIKNEQDWIDLYYGFAKQIKIPKLIKKIY